jgi:hypothetical protein
MMSFIKNRINTICNYLFDDRIEHIDETPENEEFTIVIGKHRLDRIYFDLIAIVKINRYFRYSEI